MATKHKFPRGGWKPVHPSQIGSETKRAREHGRSLHAQAEIDKHSPDKRIRGKGIFALNAQEGKFKHKVGRKRRLGFHKSSMSATGLRKRARRKRA